MYALKIDEKWKQLHHYKYNSSDWQINAGSPWEVALQIDPENPDSSIEFIQGLQENYNRH